MRRINRHLRPASWRSRISRFRSSQNSTFQSANYNRLKEKWCDIRFLFDHKYLLQWDGVFSMPSHAADNRKLQVIANQTQLDATFRDPGLLSLFKTVKGEFQKWKSAGHREDTPRTEANLRHFDAAVHYWISPPKQLVVEHEQYTANTGEASVAYQEALKKNDFGIFAPHLEKIIGNIKELNRYRHPEKSSYKGCVDYFAKGMGLEDMALIFEEIKSELAPIQRGLRQKRRLERPHLLRETTQKRSMDALLNYLARTLGEDPKTFKMAYHPIIGSYVPVGAQDMRLAIRNDADQGYVAKTIWVFLHELGHLKHMCGYEPEWHYEPIGSTVCMVNGESQAIFYQRLLGQSPRFLKFIWPRVQQAFPGLRGKTSKAFLSQGLSFIPNDRVAEDNPVTFALRGAIGFECERALMDEDLSVIDLPAFYNDRMQRFIGTKPTRLSEGLLRSPHWAKGTFGYIPCYLLGWLKAAQEYEKMCNDICDMGSQLERGRTNDLNSWLRRNVHSKARLYDTPELVRQVTHRDLCAGAFIRHVTNTYEQLSWL